ncbi:MAG: methyltransferase [Oscillospiraceae bacterium]|nr:methyltransferase [Oscillospiraceae bacterium]
MPSFDELWPNGPKFKQSSDGFRLGTDSVLLADFAARGRHKNIIDLGCGAGVLTVLLQSAYPSARVVGIEIQPAAAELARENMAVNGYAGEIITGDIRCHRALFAAGSFDLVVANPPYFPLSSGMPSPDEQRAGARGERECMLSDVCQAAAYLCRWGGSFSLVHRPERLAEVFSALRENGLEPKRLRCVQHRQSAPPNLVLIEARRGAKPTLEFAAPVRLTNADGSESEESKRIYRRI